MQGLLEDIGDQADTHVIVTIQSAGGGLPCLAGDAVADSVEDVDAVLAQGGEVGADGEPCSGSFFGAVAAGDLDLGFGGSEVSFGLVVGVWDGQIVSEKQDLAVVVAEPFQ